MVVVAAVVVAIDTRKHLTTFDELTWGFGIAFACFQLAPMTCTCKDLTTSLSDLAALLPSNAFSAHALLIQ